MADNSYIVGPKKIDIAPPPVPNYNVGEAAERDVRLFNRPELGEIAAQANQVRDQFKEQDVASRNIHTGLMNEMGALPGVGQQYDDVAQSYNKHVGALGQQMGDFGMGPVGEQVADSRLFSQMGRGAHAGLAGQAQRSQDWTRGVKAQAHVDLANRRANYLEGMRDEIAKLQAQRMGVYKGMNDQLQQRKTELDDQRFQQGLGLFEAGMQAEGMASDDELREALMEMLGKKGGGGGGGGKNKKKATGLRARTDKQLSQGIKKHKTRRKSVRQDMKAYTTGEQNRPSYQKLEKKEAKLTKGISRRKSAKKNN